jgi:hypothetical protein
VTKKVVGVFLCVFRAPTSRILMSLQAPVQLIAGKVTTGEIDQSANVF